LPHSKLMEAETSRPRTNGSNMEDFAFDFVEAGGEIVIAALLNRLEMWFFNQDLGGDGAAGLRCDLAPCFNYDSYAYLWGEGYLLFIDKDDLALTNASHLGTFSGGDFRPRLTNTPDGGFAVIGTISGCPDGLDPAEGFENFFVIKTDPSGEVEWRKSIKGPHEGSCGFAIALANDGGLVAAGNLANQIQVGEEVFNEADYLVVKLSAEPCELSGDVIGPNSTGNQYVVSGTELWDSDLSVTAQVVVLPGAELTIEGSSTAPVTIRFADSEERFDFDERSPIGIRVAAGGKLTLKYALLTGTECNGMTRMWDGISVEGRPDQEQSNAWQGYCSLENARIENARFGLAASEAWMKQGNFTRVSPLGQSVSVLSKSWLETGAKGGARIAAAQSEFRNNYRSVHFAKYLHSPNNSIFWQTDFTSNGPLADPDLSLRPAGASSYNLNQGRGTYIHASIWSTRVRFSHCDFTGLATLVPELRPRGIEGDDAMPVVNSGSMQDLLRGVWIRNLSGGLLGSVNLGAVNFDNVREGVRLGGTTMDKITNCTFANIPVQAAFGEQAPYGIFAENAKGGRFDGNEFIGIGPTGASFGLVIQNTWQDGARVSDNRFENIRYASQFLGGNPQLSARCNDYDDIAFAWTVLPKGGAGSLKNQGEDGQFTEKADNEFFDACDFETTYYSHIYSDAVAFEYHDKTGNPYPAEEDCVTTPPVDLQKHTVGTLPECADAEGPPCAPPCVILEEFIGSEQDIATRNWALRGLLHPGTDSLDNLLPYDMDDALELLWIRNEPEDRILLAGTLLNLERYSEAQDALDSLPDNTLETATFKAYIEALLQESVPLDSLSDSAYQDALDAALEEANTWAQTLAQNLRYFREGIFTRVQPQIVEELEERSLRKPRPQETPAPRAEDSVWPNPFTHTLTFSLEGLDQDKYYELTVFDATGRPVWRALCPGGQALDWTPDERLAPGLYYYMASLNGRVAQTGKLLRF
jgi:hypothetical protein